MSHAIISKASSNKITDIAALKVAVENLMGLEITKCTPRKGHYRTWKDDHGGWAGDWDLPEGVSAEEMGDNADYVISVPKSKDPKGKCYQLGIIWDEKDQCWYPAHDFYRGGYGLEEFIGKTEVKGKTVVKSHQKLMDHYKAALLATQHRAKGKIVEFTKQKDKLVLRIQ